MNIFQDYASKYHDVGYHVIPVYGKKPAVKAWNSYCHKAPSDSVLDDWIGRHPKAGVSLLFGPSTGLIGVDIDSNDEAVIAYCRKYLPMTVEKKGKRGITLFFRYDFTGNEKSVEQIKLEDRDLIEFLFLKHTVIPPSIHPDTHKPYEYGLMELLELDIDEIPFITREMINHLKSVYGTDINNTGGIDILAGRNNYLAHKCFTLLVNHSIDEVIPMVIHADKVNHPDNCYFSDASEFAGSTDTTTNASEFVANKYLSALRQNKAKGTTPNLYKKPDNKTDHDFKIHLENGFFKIGENGKGEVPLYNELAEYFYHKHSLFFEKGYFFLFDKTHFKLIHDDELRSMIHKITLRKIRNSSHRNMFFNILKDLIIQMPKKPIKPVGLINVKNGVLDVVTKKIVSHSSKWDFRNCLDYEYDSLAIAPRTMKFLDEIFDDKDSITLVREMIAYILIGGHPFLNTAFGCLGSGANGKSTLMDVIVRMIGEKNVSSVALSNFGDRFAKAQFLDKMLNVDDDVSNKSLNDSLEMFKKVVSGGLIDAEFKGKPHFEFRPNLRFIFNLNEKPRFKGANKAIYRRITFIVFSKTISDKDQDHFLVDKLYAEIPGILNWAIDLLPFEKGFLLTTPKITAETMDEYKLEIDSVLSFIDSCVEIDFHRYKAPVYTRGLFSTYKKYCEENNFDQFNQKDINRFSGKFYEHLKDAAVNQGFDPKKIKHRGKSARGFIGILVDFGSF